MERRIESREAGFTLVELVIAIAVSGILMTAVVTAFVSVARGTADLHDRFLQSQDAQLLATHFPTDVQSADPNLAPDTSAGGGWAVCSGTAPAGTANVLQLRWSESSTSGTTNYAAAYRTRQSPSGTERQLVRYFCADSATPVLESHVVARNLADQTDPAKQPVVGYDPVDPRVITMKLFAFESDIGDYDYTFEGRMRTPLPAAAAPEVVSILRAGASPTSASSVQWTVLFDTAVNGVDVADFSLDGLSGASVTGVTGGPTSYTVTAGTGGGAGGLRLDLIDDNTITDAATGAALGGTVLGDGSFTSGESYTITSGGPAPSVIEVRLQNGGADGEVDKGDTVVVTFSEALDLNSLCTGWSGATLSSGEDIVVNVTNSGGNDVLSITTTGSLCSSSAFNFGTLELDEDYVSSDVSFKGNGSGGNTPSTITWTSGTNKLTISLGKRSSGSGFNSGRPVSNPTYQPSSSITDPDGNALPLSYTESTIATRF